MARYRCADRADLSAPPHPRRSGRRSHRPEQRAGHLHEFRQSAGFVRHRGAVALAGGWFPLRRYADRPAGARCSDFGVWRQAPCGGRDRHRGDKHPGSAAGGKRARRRAGRDRNHGGRRAPVGHGAEPRAGQPPGPFPARCRDETRLPAFCARRRSALPPRPDACGRGRGRCHRHRGLGRARRGFRQLRRRCAVAAGYRHHTTGRRHHAERLHCRG